ncbi:STAS domain-containing protein [Streptomyces sp. WMMB 322]|uniref:STAS domain-containing protein n=1 Tax=Streptomyces sp. WMMB 322 TaxID=1286821 RepID=UPI0034A0C174
MHGDEEVLVISEELNVQSMYTLRSYIAYCLRRGRRRIRLDMNDVTWCDGSSLHGIAGLQDALHAVGGYLRITSVSEPVRDARADVALPHGIFGVSTPG